MTNPKVTRYLAFPDEIKTQSGAKKLLHETIQAYDTSEPLFALAVEEKSSDAFAGCCGLNPLEEKTVEIFYTILPKFWGQGMAAEIAKALVSYLFEKLNIEIVKAFVVPGHEASKRVAEKVGFQETGLVENPNFDKKVHEYILVKK